MNGKKIFWHSFWKQVYDSRKGQFRVNNYGALAIATVIGLLFLFCGLVAHYI